MDFDDIPDEQPQGDQDQSAPLAFDDIQSEIPAFDDMEAEKEVSSSAGGAAARGAIEPFIPKGTGSVSERPISTILFGPEGHPMANAEEWLLEQLGLGDTGATGKDQTLADETLHDKARFAGQMIPQLAMQSPMANIAERAVGAATFGGAQAIGGAMSGDQDWGKVGMAAAGGALFSGVPKGQMEGLRAPKPAEGLPSPDAKPVDGEVIPPEANRNTFTGDPEIDHNLKFAYENRDGLDPNDPMYKFWDNHITDLHSQANGKGSVEEDAHLGPATDDSPFTYRDADRANDVTTTAVGVAAENSRAPEVRGAGNPVGAPMVGRIAQRPGDPGRDYRKDAQQAVADAVAEPNQKLIGTDHVHDDVKAAMGGDEPTPVAEPPGPQIPTGITPQEPAPAPQVQQPGPKDFQGLKINIENPKGSVRSGEENGKPWSVTMPDHYGEIEGTRGADGDKVDAFIGPHEHSPDVHVIDQNNPATGQFDEHKAMMGYPSREHAVEAYKQAHDDGGAQRIGAVTSMPMEKFKQWLQSGRTREPVAKPVTAAVTDAHRKALGAFPKVLEAIERLPHEQQGKAVERALALVEEAKGAASDAKSRKQVEVAGTKVQTGGGERDVRKRTSVAAWEKAYNEHGPAVNAFPTAPTEIVALAKRAVETAKAANGGNNPLVTYIPREKPTAFKWLKAATAATTGKPSAIKDFKSAHALGGETNAPSPVGKDVDAELAKRKRPSVEDAEGGATVYHNEPEPEREVHPLLDNSKQEESAQYKDAHDHLTNWLNAMDDDTYKLLSKANDHELALTLKNTQDPAKTMSTLMDQLAEAQKKDPPRLADEKVVKRTPVKTAADLPGRRIDPNSAEGKAIAASKAGKLTPEQLEAYKAKKAGKKISGPDNPELAALEAAEAEGAQNRMPERGRIRDLADMFLKDEAGSVGGPHITDGNPDRAERVRAGNLKLMENTLRNHEERANGRKPADYWRSPEWIKKLEDIGADPNTSKARAQAISELLEKVKPTIDGTEKSAMEHWARFLSNESGAIPLPKVVQKMSDWMNTKVRDFFTPTADPATIEYGNQIGMAGTKLNTKITRIKAEVLANARVATYPDGSVPLPAEFSKMYRAKEQGDLSVLSPKQKKYWDDFVQPLLDKEESAYRDLRTLTQQLKLPGHDTMPEPKNLPGSEYMPRRRKLQDDDEYNPITNSLSNWAASAQERNWFALRDMNAVGNRRIYRVDDDGNMIFYKNRVAGSAKKAPGNIDPREIGSTFLQQGGKEWEVVHATIDELMQHGADKPTGPGKGPQPLIYSDNPVVAASDALVGMRTALAKVRLLDNIISDPAFQAMSAKTEKEAKEKFGENNYAKTILPQLNERYMPKTMAWALDDIVHSGFAVNSKTGAALSNISQGLLKPFYFLGPEVHVFNELDKFLNMSPIFGKQLPSLPKHFKNAVTSVNSWKTGGDALQHEIMEAGGNPMFAHAATARLMPQIGKMVGEDMAIKPWKYDPLMKLFKTNTRDVLSAMMQKSNKAMWYQSDVLYTATYSAFKAKGMSPKDAVNETEKIIDSYTMPPTLGRTVGMEGSDAGRFVKKFLTDSRTSLFGRYAYGLTHTASSIVKNIAAPSSSPARRAAGVAQMIMLFSVMPAVYAYVSHGYSKITGDDSSEFEQRGLTKLANMPFDSKKGATDIVGRAWTPSVPVDTALRLWEGKDFAGRPIRDTPGHLAEFLAGQAVSPLRPLSAGIEQKDAGFGLQRFLESNVGLKTPSPGAEKYDAQRDRRNAAQERYNRRHPRGVIDEFFQDR